MVLHGECLCGASKIEVDIDLADATVGFDHCNSCQKQTGSAYSLVLVAPRNKVKISGKDKTYSKPGDSGKEVKRIFCSECGSPLAHAPDAAPDIIAVKAGILDVEVKRQLKPSVDIYLKEALPLVTQRAPNGFQGMPEH